MLNTWNTSRSYSFCGFPVSDLCLSSLSGIMQVKIATSKLSAGWGTVVSSWEMDRKKCATLTSEKSSKLIHFQFKAPWNTLSNLTWYFITIISRLSSSRGDGLRWKFLSLSKFTREFWFLWGGRESILHPDWKAVWVSNRPGFFELWERWGCSHIEDELLPLKEHSTYLCRLMEP